MKESKFIELLNLYLDQQIEPADAALLEEEIAAHPARRRVYEQYCRMHRACSVLFEQSRPAASASPMLANAVAAADEKVTTFQPEPRSYNWAGYATGLAAAACVAFVFVQRATRTPDAAAAPAREEMVQIASTPVPTKNTGLVMAPLNYQSVVPVVSRSNRQLSPGAGEGPSLDWMRTVQFTPITQISTNQLTFDHPGAPVNETGVFQSRLPVQSSDAAPKMELMNASAEKAAWQFQR